MTRQFGFLLLIGGFLAGAYATALHVRETEWLLFIPAALTAGIGVLMIKRQARGEARSAGVLDANRSELGDSLANIVAELDAMLADPQIGSRALRERIDGRLRDDLRRFADARESMMYLYGTQSYADIMSEFAAGERYVNRVWSASADGYMEEAAAYLERAATQFRHARAELQRVSERAG